MMINVEQSVEWELVGETEVFGENLPLCHFVNHKSHMNPGRCCWIPATNSLSYGTYVAISWAYKMERGEI
jgi:hypothetical protein